MILKTILSHLGDDRKINHYLADSHTKKKSPSIYSVLPMWTVLLGNQIADDEECLSYISIPANQWKCIIEYHHFAMPK